jgi:preprotein translocase SecE subunit
VAYRKDQGRYARMAAFWALTLLAAYGCLGGLIITLDRSLSPSFNQTFVEQFPLFGTLKVSTLIALSVLGLVAFALHRFLNRPRAADLLIDTEAEMRKVTWPSVPETWAGTLAVMLTVVILFVFLTVADYLFGLSVSRLMGVR